MTAVSSPDLGHDAMKMSPSFVGNCFKSFKAGEMGNILNPPILSAMKGARRRNEEGGSETKLRAASAGAQSDSGGRRAELNRGAAAGLQASNLTLVSNGTLC